MIKQIPGWHGTKEAVEQTLFLSQMPKHEDDRVKFFIRGETISAYT